MMTVEGEAKRVRPKYTSERTIKKKLVKLSLVEELCGSRRE